MNKIIYKYTPKIFISYCTRSAISVALGDQLKERLEANGFDTFLDRYDVQVGGSFVEQIGASLHDCHGAVLLLAEEAKKSVWVADEAAFLMTRKQQFENFKIVPVVIPPVKSVEAFFGERSELWKVSKIQGVVVDSDNLARSVDKIVEAFEPLKKIRDFWGKQLPLSSFGTLVDTQGVQRLDPRARFLPLIGREGELDELYGWLNGGKPVSVRALIGGAGRGKTRLAMELVLAVEAWGWHAGFLSGEALTKLVAQAECGWSCPTLAVIDYAAPQAAILHQWLKQLSERQKKQRPVSGKVVPLRILLLERMAEEGSGWWQTLLGSGSWKDADVRDLLDPPKPVHLDRLSSAQGEEILIQMLRQSGVRHPTAPQMPPKEPEWRGEPLFAMMAGQLLAEREELPATRDALALILAGREKGRIAGFARRGEHQEEQGIMLNHLAAFATLCGGLDGSAVFRLAQTEKDALGLSSAGDPWILADLLHQALPGPQNGVEALRPDIIGEAFFLLALGGGRQAASLAAVQRAFLVADKKCIASLVRCGQDFVYAGHQEPLAWLGALVENPDVSLDMLWSIEQELPHNSLGLDAFAARLRQSLLDRYRALVSDDKTNGTFIAMQAIAANNLSISLGNLGWHEAALATIEETVRIQRELSANRTDVFMLELARSLNNLSNRLSALGRREGALDAIEEAVRIYRELSVVRPDAFMPDLASLLNNLSYRLRDLGRREEGLAAIEEAVRMFRELSVDRPGAFMPDLALSLNNLSVLLSDLGRREGALAAIEEAVRIRRELSADRPDAFMPDLAQSLNNLSLGLSDLGRREEALAAIEGAERIYRELSEVRPDAFMPDLAMSLNNLSLRLSALGRREEALAAAEEAVTTLAPYFMKLPEAFGQWMGTFVGVYEKRLRELEGEAKIMPILEEIKKLLPGT
ncbi:MAG: toll/interleukin-1 receptor domain-containing protein [Magnetococcales bacterium]|nr:toll/interleukin-1 receptor domain-containing protein [Magnetococcales bacterium]